MSRLVFFDVATSYAYDDSSLRTRGMGGTQSSTIRVAEALSSRYEVFVLQGPRREQTTSSRGVQYLPATELMRLGPVDHLVCVRTTEALPWLRDRMPKARLINWIHVVNNSSNWVRFLQRSADAVVCVSEYHRKHTLAQSCWPCADDNVPLPSVEVIYNPIDDDLDIDGTEVDRNKLVFFSAPVRGLDYTLGVFDDLQQEHPELTIYVANPGYDMWELPEVPGLHDMGALPHHELMQHVRSSLCTFYLNAVVPEVFGLVYAESNAVGTPVLTHPLGAAEEILHGAGQAMDITDSDAVKRRLLAWRDGERPKVCANPAFRASAVADTWHALLQS